MSRDLPSLVATDVDGTLIDDEERVSDRTRAAVQAVVSSGTPFVLATGRPPRWIPPVIEQLGFAPMAVCANGAVLYDSAADRVLSAAVLSADELAWVADVANSVLPGCGLAAERIGASAHDAATPQFVSAPGYEHAWLNPDNTELADHEVIAEPAVKLLIRMASATSHEMAEALAPQLCGLVDVTYSTDNGLIEISASGVTKASGLQLMAEHLGVAADGIVAFGDMPNDIPMLSMARHGVAMENAHPDTKAAADEVTATNTEDGVARILERWWR
ncbi:MULTISPECIES: Cof-type HAD-IIB family hydrolase [Rhodococcus]|uniref:Cof-type HAD-IIB family hydrolase n=1 Tax=Rhodococcus aetherivorans TaxID=191292 RepID=A0A059MGW3_9NOCA|nr:MULTISPECIES: Cof-type HAD-IIB family hydrolase [Rhodococcus]KDE10449.1 HAD family hydrolase [Rhodococcus aetherivorans]MBC2590538.1 Cof-type HAD-IIB family hydrolase [Rhodococcus aetherivorans]MDV6295462.1 Cof-type HAD-IIB family hydrolase [Rhodococcus aetherivorans]NGP26779.1 Cof-type HAD-IIB family hydrolase [Rhodococcus aetherivorans]OLL21455.1 HAD family hydrolase [Rhodococcus sp. M8]